MQFNPCPLCNHPNELTASSCAVCGVGMVAICAHCGAVNNTVAHRCQQCNTMLPAGEVAADAASAAANPELVRASAAQAAEPPGIKLRFNADRSVSIEAPDGHGGVAVHTVTAPTGAGATSAWLSVGEASPRAASTPAVEPPAPVRATTLVPLNTALPALPIRPVPREWAPRPARRAAAAALLILVLVMAAGFFSLASPDPRAWLARWTGTGPKAASAESTTPGSPSPVTPQATVSETQPLAAGVPVPEVVAPSPATAPATENPALAQPAEPADLKIGAVPQATPVRLVGTSVAPARPAAVVPPGTPPAPAAASAVLPLPSVESLDNEPTSAGAPRRNARPVAVNPPPAQLALNPLETSSNSSAGPSGGRPAPRPAAAGPSTDSSTALAAALGTAAPNRKNPPSPARPLACTDSLAALGLCNNAAPSAHKD